MTDHKIKRENEVRKSLIKITLLLVACLYSATSFSQLNIKIAYNLNYSAFESNNALLDAYNKENLWLAENFNSLRFLNGVQIGSRLRNEFIGIDFTYERSSAERLASGVNFNTENIVNQLNYRLNRFSLGLESYIKQIGIGANISFERFSINKPLSGLDSQQEILKEERFSNRIYLILSSSGNEMLSVSLQPYVLIPWSHFNLSPLRSYLNLSSDEYNIQRNLHFGLSLVFYNGPQS